MTVAPGAGPARGADSRVRPGVVTGLLTAAVSGVLVVVTWFVFVATPQGQRVDAAVVDGARESRLDLWSVAGPVLDLVSIPAVAIVLVAAMTIAAFRRRWALAIQVAVLMGGANLTTQVLKHTVFPYPDLGVAYSPGNSLPSGHTTAAASVAAALVFVVPPRARSWAAVLGATYAGLTGVSTLVGQWHRPSDVVAAYLVVLAWSGVACALAGTGTRRAARPGRPAGAGHERQTRIALLSGVGILTAASLCTGVPAVAALSRSWGRDVIETRGDLLDAYAGGALGVTSAACLVFAVLLLVRHSARARLAVVDEVRPELVPA